MDQSCRLADHEIGVHERTFSGFDRVRYRVGALISPYYRERRAALGSTGLRAKALRRCVTSRDGRVLFVKNFKAACTTGTELMHHYDHGRYYS